MRRTIFIISALAGALGAAAPALAQSDDVLGDDEYPADDYAAPTEEAATPYADQQTYDDTGSYDDGSYANSYDDSSYGYNDPAPYDRGAVSTGQFQRALSPYGRWVRTPEYGLVWIPSRRVVGDDFVPYATGGNWRYSDAGWTFVSDWNWGWAPFHYGRWYRAPRLGWVWIPGSVWAPAWVDWRYGDGYIGWAPLPPRRFAYLLRSHDYWFFCSARDMWRPHVWRYRVRSSPFLFRVAALARRPFVRGRARWFAGPNPRLIERVTRRPVARVDVRPRRQRAERRVEMPRQQRIMRQDRIETPRQQRIMRQERVERQQRITTPRQERVERPRQERVERPRQQRVERPQQMRVEQRQQMREQRQQQRQEMRQQQRQEQRQEQRVQRQQERRVERQQAREQRQPARERRRRPDR
jgi:hypothetical protein